MNEERPTILIVDDDEEIINLLKDHFKRRNCEAVATADPTTVVDKLKNFSIKLMLLDLKMRKLDGFKVLDKIKEAGLKLPSTIVITGFLLKYQDKLKSYHIGADDVVPKPFDFEVMEQCINRKLGREIVASEVGTEYESKLYEKNRCRIGFVEDEPDIVDTLTELFTERNYKVIGFRNGTAALAGLRNQPVDILFVDMKLPGIQGDHLIDELSKLPKPPHMIPISADPLPDDIRERLNHLGCGQFMEKPFVLTELIEKVKTIAIEKGLLG